MNCMEGERVVWGPAGGRRSLRFRLFPDLDALEIFCSLLQTRIMGEKFTSIHFILMILSLFVRDFNFFVYSSV